MSKYHIVGNHVSRLNYFILKTSCLSCAFALVSYMGYTIQFAQLHHVPVSKAYLNVLSFKLMTVIRG